MFKKFKEGAYPRSTSRPSTASILRRSQTSIPTKKPNAGIISAWGARPPLSKRKSSIHIAPHQATQYKKPQVLLQQASGVWAEIQLFQFHQTFQKGAPATQRKYSDNTGFYFPNPKQESAYHSEPYGALSQRSPLMPTPLASKHILNNSKIAKPVSILHFSSKQGQSRPDHAYPKHQYMPFGDQSPLGGTKSEMLPQISYRSGITSSSKSPEKKKLQSCSAKQLVPSIGPKTPVRMGPIKRIHFKRRKALQNCPIAIFCFTGVVGDVFKAKLFSEQSKKLYLRPGLRQGLNLLRGHFQVVLYLNPSLPRSQKNALVAILRAQNILTLFDGVYLHQEDGKCSLQDCLKHAAFDFQVQEKYERMIVVDSIDKEAEELKKAESEELLQEIRSRNQVFSGSKGNRAPRLILLQNPRMHSSFLGTTMLSLSFFLLKYSGAKEIALNRFVPKSRLHQLNSALVYYETQSSPIKNPYANIESKELNSASKISKATRRMKSEHQADLSQFGILLPQAERLNICRCLETQNHSTQEVLSLITECAMSAYRARLNHELKGRKCQLSPKGQEVREIRSLLSSKNQLTHSMANMLQKNFQLLKHRHAQSTTTLQTPSSPTGSLNQKLMSQISAHIKHSSQSINPREIYESSVKDLLSREKQEVVVIMPGALRSGRYEQVGSLDVEESSVSVFELMSGVSSKTGRACVL